MELDGARHEKRHKMHCQKKLFTISDSGYRQSSQIITRTVSVLDARFESLHFQGLAKIQVERVSRFQPSEVILGDQPDMTILR